METMKGWMARAQNLLNKDQQFILGMIFTACLNWADFFSDWYVTLQYGCVIRHDLSTSCDGVDPQAECEVHGWWFGLSLFLLIGSNLVQSAMWTYITAVDEFGWVESCLKLAGIWVLLFVAGLCQLHYVVDIVLALRGGAPTDVKIDRIIARELATKIGESAPQLYLQSYVLFAVGAHGSPMKMFSVIISILALAHGIIKTLLMFEDRGVEKTLPLKGFVYRAVAAIWLATDQGLRSAAIALVLSAEVRLHGSMLLGFFMLLVWAMFVWTNARDPDSEFAVKGGCPTVETFRDAVRLFVLGVCFLLVSLLGSLFTCYVIPVLWLHDLFEWSKPAFDRVVVIRWVEMASCAALALLLAKNVCGYTPDREVGGLIGLLAFNMLCYCCMRCCFHKDGRLKWLPFEGWTAEEASKADVSRHSSRSTLEDDGSRTIQRVTLKSLKSYEDEEVLQSDDANVQAKCKEEVDSSNLDLQDANLKVDSLDHETLPVQDDTEGVNIVLPTGDMAEEAEGEANSEMKVSKGKKKVGKTKKVEKTKEDVPNVAERASPSGETIGKGQGDEEAAEKPPTSPKGKVAKPKSRMKKSKKEVTPTADETAIGRHQEDGDAEAD
ncbi:unnamed protein product [Durusdinium trenchii]